MNRNSVGERAEGGSMSGSPALGQRKDSGTASQRGTVPLPGDSGGQGLTVLSHPPWEGKVKCV